MEYWTLSTLQEKFHQYIQKMVYQQKTLFIGKSIWLIFGYVIVFHIKAFEWKIVKNYVENIGRKGLISEVTYILCYT